VQFDPVVGPKKPLRFPRYSMDDKIREALRIEGMAREANKVASMP
jgi:hypothetical protein